MTPYYQWETSQLGNPHQYQQYEQGCAPNGYGAGTSYQEYDNVSYYRDGKYSKAKKKSKKRDMRQVYGYSGSHKRAGAGGASHLQAAQQQYYDPEKGNWYSANGSAYAVSSGEGHASAPPQGVFKVDSSSPYHFDRNLPAGHEAYHQGQHSAVESSAPGQHSSQSDGHGHGHGRSPSYDANHYGNASFKQQTTPEHMRSQSTAIPTAFSTNFSIPTPSYANDTGSIPAFQSADRQRANSTVGSKIIDSDFVNRFHAGGYTSLTDAVAMLFKEAEAMYFPADRSSSEWLKKTGRMMEYVNRVQQLSVMSEDELALVYERVVGGGN
jgi:hypothetical protein